MYMNEISMKLFHLHDYWVLVFIKFVDTNMITCHLFMYFFILLEFESVLSSSLLTFGPFFLFHVHESIPFITEARLECGKADFCSLFSF